MRRRAVPLRSPASARHTLTGALLLCLLGCSYEYDKAALTAPYLDPQVSVDRPNGVLANGKDQAVVTVNAGLASADATEVPAHETKVEIESGTATLTAVAPDGSGGCEQWLVSSAVSGTVKLRVTVKTDAETMRLPTLYEIRFVANIRETLVLRSPATIVPAAAPYALASGDFDGDGQPDIATIDSIASSLTFYAGKAGGLTTPAVVTLPNGPRNMVVGDMNADGILDLAVAHVVPPLTMLSLVLGGKSGLSSSSLSVALPPNALGLGDVDGNGALDLVSLSTNAQRLTVHLNDGVKGSTTPYTTSIKAYVEHARATALAVGQLDGDQYADVAVVHASESGFTYQADNASIWLGTTEGLTPATPLSVGAAPYAVVMADLSAPADGLNELLVLSRTQELRVFSHQGGAPLAFGPPVSVQVGVNPSALAVGDLNHDGIPDVVVANAGGDATNLGGSISILLGLGDGQLAEQVTYATGDGPMGVAIGDFDQDGHADIVAANYGSGNLTVFRGK